MSDDEMPELEDLTQDLEKVRLAKGINNQASGKETEIKVNVIESNENKTNLKPSSITPHALVSESNQSSSTKKDDEDDFGKGFGKGFFKKLRAAQTNQQPSHSKVEDLTHIKSAPGTTNKTKTVETFNKNLKDSLPSNGLNGLADNIANKKDEWLNQDLLMKIAQKPSLMKYFMDPRFTTIIQEMQRNPKECIEKYGNNAEFSSFIKEFSELMGIHFTNLAGQKSSSLGGNSNLTDPQVQKVLSDPKVIPFLTKLKKEGKIDVEELNRDAYLAQQINFLVDKGILNIQKMNLTENE